MSDVQMARLFEELDELQERVTEGSEELLERREVLKMKIQSFNRIRDNVQGWLNDEEMDERMRDTYEGIIQKTDDEVADYEDGLRKVDILLALRKRPEGFMPARAPSVPLAYGSPGLGKSAKAERKSEGWPLFEFTVQVGTNGPAEEVVDEISQRLTGMDRVGSLREYEVDGIMVRYDGGKQNIP